MSHRNLIPWLLLAAIAIAAALFHVPAFLAESQQIHFWDGRYYHLLARDGWAALLADGLDGLRDHLARHRQGDVNAYHTVALMPGLAVLGGDRLGFILSVALIYVVPLVLAIGWVGAAAARGPGRGWVGLWTGLSALLLGATWLATLRGYPDAGAAVAVAAGLALILGDRDLDRWRTVLALGLLLGLAAVFRRHFAYAGVAVYGAIVLDRIWVARADPWAWARTAGRLAVAGLVSVAVMGLLVPELTWRALTQDYHDIYAGYQRTPMAVLDWLRQTIGVPAALLALAGYGAALGGGLTDGRAVRLLGGAALIWVVLWLFGVGQLSPQYILHILPAVVAAGLGLGLVALWRQRDRGGRIAAGVLALAVAANGAWTFADPFLAPADREALYLDAPAGLPAAVSPGRDHAADMAAYMALVDHLRGQAAPEAGILVIGSSGWLNDELLASAEERRVGPERRRLNIRPAAHVDSRDWLPAADFGQADWLVVGLPPGYHLPPAEQEVVTVAARAVAEGWPIMDAFEQVRRWSLSEGREIQVWRRTRPSTLAEIADATVRMAAAVTPMPARQLPWMPVTGPGFLHPLLQINEITPAGAQAFTMEVAPHDSFQALAWARVAPLASGSTVTGATTVEGTCPPLELTAERFDQESDVVARRPVPGPVDIVFPEGGRVALRLRPLGPVTGLCRVTGTLDLP